MPDGYLFPKGSSRENGVELKTIIDESPSISSNVSDSPVEEGKQISDHVEDKPVTGNISAVFATIDIYDKLKQYRNNKQVLTYASDLDIIENLIITDLSPKRSPDYGTGFRCTIGLKQIRIAESKTTDVRLPTDPPTGKDVEEESKDKGEKQPDTDNIDEDATENEDDSETTKETKQSILSGGIEAIGSWFGG